MSCSEELLGGGYVPVRGKGVRVWDDTCKYCINCTSQFWGLYLGYAYDEINQIIKIYNKNMIHPYKGFDNKPRFHLANKLAKLAALGVRCNLVYPSLIEMDLLKQPNPDIHIRNDMAKDVPLEGSVGRRILQQYQCAYYQIWHSILPGSHCMLMEEENFALKNIHL